MSDQQQSDKQHALDQLSINALRFLAVDAVEKANPATPAPLSAARPSPICSTTSS